MQKPRRPVIPRAKADYPRPYQNIDTAKLLNLCRDLSESIETRKAELKEHTEVRVQMLLELERRDVSYRAMGRHIGISNVSIQRILDRWHKRQLAKEPVT